MLRHSAKDLERMSLRELATAGKSVGLEFTKNHTKAERRKRILTRYTELDLTEQAGPAEAPETPHTSATPSPEFLRKADAVTSADEAPAPQHGGARPGAGRPAGMTNDLSRMNQLSEHPHPPIKKLMELCFDVWADAVGCDDVRLTRDEAFDLALPLTNAAEYTGVIRYVPVWSEIAVSLAWAMYTTVQRKAAIARAHRTRVASKTVESDTDGKEVSDIEAGDAGPGDGLPGSQ
jgi:hypothetical protein